MDEILASIRKIIENNEAQPELAADADDAEDFTIATESHSGLLDHPAVVERFHAAERRAAAAERLAEAAVARFRAQLGVDLRTLRLTDEGFVRS